MQVDISIEKSHHFKLTQALLVYRSNQQAFVTKGGVTGKASDRAYLCQFHGLLSGADQNFETTSLQSHPLQRCEITPVR